MQGFAATTLVLRAAVIALAASLRRGAIFGGGPFLAIGRSKAVPPRAMGTTWAFVWGVRPRRFTCLQFACVSASALHLKRNLCQMLDYGLRRCHSHNKNKSTREGMSRAFIFPGQGSQAAGMGKALAETFPQARATLAEVDEALGQNLSSLMFEGPQAELTLTANAQPALLAASLAVVRVLEAEAGLNLANDASFVAGHSLGEYSALAAAGSLGIGEAARLLRLRGLAMQAAVPVGVGAMGALLGLDCDRAQEIAKQAALETGDGAICEVANDNGGGQVVVSGSAGAVNRAVEIAKEQGARRSILLPVSAPFHCSLMRPAAEAMAAALASAAIKPPCVPLVSNVLAAPVTNPDEIRRLLVAQVTGMVRWRESIAFIANAGITLFIECGAGKVLSGLGKRIATSAHNISIGVPGDIERYRATA
jgi:[acyl-carrier-protein] S-malonyltransferase